MVRSKKTKNEMGAIKPLNVNSMKTFKPIICQNDKNVTI